MKKAVILGLGLLVASAGYALAADEHKGHNHGASSDKAAAETSEHKFCVVCGPEEKMEDLPFSYKHEEEKYRFCSLDCLKAFKQDPHKFLKDGHKHS